MSRGGDSVMTSSRDLPVQGQHGNPVLHVPATGASVWGGERGVVQCSSDGRRTASVLRGRCTQRHGMYLAWCVPAFCASTARQCCPVVVYFREHRRVERLGRARAHSAWRLAPCPSPVHALLGCPRSWSSLVSQCGSKRKWRKQPCNTAQTTCERLGQCRQATARGAEWSE